MKSKWMTMVVSLALALGLLGALPAPGVLAASEDDVVINEFMVNPSSGKEYIELLVTAPGGVDMQGWTLSDVGTRTGSTGVTEGDVTLPSSAAYLNPVPQGTYVVIVLATPSANSNTLTEDISLDDGNNKLVLIVGTTAGLTTAGTMDVATNDNFQLYAGIRASGTLVDQVLCGSNSSLISGATWGDNDPSTTTDNVNGGSSLPSGSAGHFVPTANTQAGFQDNDTGARFVVDGSSYGSPGTQNAGVSDDSAVTNPTYASGSLPGGSYFGLNNSGDVSLAGTVKIHGVLTLTSGLLTLGDNTLTLGSAASVSGSPDASKMVVTDVDGTQTGKLCKVWGSGAFTYPIGDNRGTAEYSPVTFTPTSPSGLTVCFRVVDNQHPSRPNNISDYLTRYWSGEATAGSFTTYTGVFTFINDGSDVVGSTTNMLPKRWTGAFPWEEQATALSVDTFTWTGGSTLSDFTAFKSGVLAVTLADFFAQQVNDHVLVTWETASELGNLGFNLYRGTSPAGPDRRLNDLLIPSQSLGNPGGFVYTWEDYADLVPGTTYYYWVEDVDVNGAATRHGPVSVDFVTPTAVTLNGLQASPAAGAAARPWLWIVLVAGAALGASRMRR